MLRFPPLEDYVELAHTEAPLTAPARAPVLTLTSTALFPHCPARLTVLGARHHRLLSALGNEAFPCVLAIARRQPGQDAPRSTSELFDVGVIARVRAVKQDQGEAFSALVEAGPRSRLLGLPVQEPHLLADLEVVADPRVDLDSSSASEIALLRDAARRALTEEFRNATWALDFVQGRNDAATLAGIAAAELDLSLEQRQRLLELPPAQRVRRITASLKNLSGRAT